MLLTIHDANLRKVAFIDNEKQATLNYFNDTWTRYLETGSSTFDFTVFKKAIISDTGQKRAYNYLNEKAFVSFQYKGKTYLHTIRKVEENEQVIKCHGINLNLELINEYANPYKSPRAMTFKEYCDSMDLLNFTFLKIGVNEISTQKISAEWEGTDTKLNRLLSLAKKFGAEIEFDTYLNADSSIKSFVVNVYHENDDTHQGVGRVSPTVLKYGKNLKTLTRTIDKTNIYNMVVPTGRDDQGNTIYISGLGAWSVNNSRGEREFYQAGEGLYAPLSMQMYPAAFTSGTMGDQWIRKDMTVESSNPEVIRSTAYRELKKNCYPAVTYEAEGFADLETGDTVQVYDDGFSPVLLLEMRVSEQTISFTNPKNNKTTFSNAKALENLLSQGIQERLDRMIEDAKPYTVKVSTNNGTAFKNGQGQSVVTPTLMKGNRVINSGWRWVVNGEIKATSPTYIVKAADINQTMVLTIAAWIDNQEVASEQITFLNASDGAQGVAGKAGADGKTTYFHTAWSYSADGMDRFTTVYPNLNLLDGTSTKVVQANSWMMQVADIKYDKSLGSDLCASVMINNADHASDLLRGAATIVIETFDKSGKSLATVYGDGIGHDTNGLSQCHVSIDDNTASVKVFIFTNDMIQNAFYSRLKIEKGSIATPYMPSASEVKTSDYPSYIGTYSDDKVSDSVKPSEYTWNLIRGNDGNDGIAGKDGVGIRTTTVVYAGSTSGTVPPTSGWSSQIPSVSPGQYLWTKTTWSYTDNTSETGFSVAKMGETGAKGDKGDTGQRGLDGLQGAKGEQGVPGERGADGRTQYTHIAYSNSADGRTDFSTSASDRAYIGMYVDFTSQDSTNPSDYAWTLVKGADGTQGTPGKPGADGRTPYFHTAYSYSADGTDRFTTVYPRFNLLKNTKNLTATSTSSSWGTLFSSSQIYDSAIKSKSGVSTMNFNFDVHVPLNATIGGAISLQLKGQTYQAHGNVGTNDFNTIVGQSWHDIEQSDLGKTIRLSFPIQIDTKYKTFDSALADTDSIVIRQMKDTSGLVYYNIKLEEGSITTPYMPSSSEVTTADYPRYIGQYSNFMQADSTNPSDYIWSLIRGNDGKDGIPGKAGADGRTPYVHLAYADTISGSGFSQTDNNKAYIGMYQDFNAEDSNNPQDYRWSKWKGSDGKDGIPGKAGADGRTTYFHRAWANSADGRYGFSTSDSTNKRYLGTLTDFTEADSLDPTRYKWTALYDNVAGGNRNYFKNGRTQRINTEEAGTYDMRTYIVDDFWENPDRLKPYYVRISFEISLSPALSKDTQAAVRFSATPWYNSWITLKAGITTPQKFEFVINLSGANETYKTDNVFVRFGTNHGFPANLTVTLDNAMLSIGTNFLGYVKAIEDVEAELEAKADQVLTQEQLNALSEQAQIHEAELKAKASMEALSDLEKAYNSFVKANADNQAQSEKDLAETGRRIELLTTQFGGLAELKTFIDTYMKSTNEGLIIGKNDASSTIKVSSDRISMFSAGKEVMYISQGVINIDNGIFTASVQIGRFRTEQYNLNLDMNVIRYVG